MRDYDASVRKDGVINEFSIPSSYGLIEDLEGKFKHYFTGYMSDENTLRLYLKMHGINRSVQYRRYLNHMTTVAKSAMQNLYDIDRLGTVDKYGIRTRLETFENDKIHEYFMYLIPLFYSYTPLSDDLDSTLFELMIGFKMA